MVEIVDIGGVERSKEKEARKPLFSSYLSSLF